jgi:glycosyltransferase involved in cell wall biosynthesis
LISVIIPTHNRSSTLRRALDSVFLQTFRDFEVIVVDDGSIDNTKSICDEYELTYIHQENQGVSSARNRGVLASKGEWISFLDSDDRWHANKLQKQFDFIKDSSHSFVHSNEVWIRNGVRVNPHKKHKKGGGDQFVANLNHCVISPSTVILKKDLFEYFDGFDESYPVCEDYDLWLKIISTQEIGFIEDPLVDKFGGHEDQLSTRYFAMDYYRIKSLYWIFKNRNLSQDKENALLETSIKKCKVLIQGYKKHNNLNNLAEIESISHELNDVFQV